MSRSVLLDSSSLQSEIQTTFTSYLESTFKYLNLGQRAWIPMLELSSLLEGFLLWKSLEKFSGTLGDKALGIEKSVNVLV